MRCWRERYGFYLKRRKQYTALNRMNVLGYIIIIVLIICVLYLFLIFPRTFRKPDRTPFLHTHYAHRGLFDNRSEAPENSLEAFKRAVEHGYGIELDVQLSKDNVPVVFHDASLKRMCGVDGNVWEYTLAELKELHLADSKAKIPTFEEALQVIAGKVPVIVEYKLDRVQTKVCELANELLATYSGAYCMESFHPLALLWYKKNRPDSMRGQLSMEFWHEEKYKKRHEMKLVAFLLTNVCTRPDFIAYQHTEADNISRCLAGKLGALSVAWTIKSREQYEAVKDKFDLFIFDSFKL